MWVEAVASSQMSGELSESVRDMDAASSFEAESEAEEASGEAVTDGEGAHCCDEAALDSD